jgi:hypothetical protein
MANEDIYVVLQSCADEDGLHELNEIEVSVFRSLDDAKRRVEAKVEFKQDDLPDDEKEKIVWRDTAAEGSVYANMNDGETIFIMRNRIVESAS